MSVGEDLIRSAESAGQIDARPIQRKQHGRAKRKQYDITPDRKKQTLQKRSGFFFRRKARTAIEEQHKTQPLHQRQEGVCRTSKLPCPDRFQIQHRGYEGRRKESKQKDLNAVRFETMTDKIIDDQKQRPDDKHAGKDRIDHGEKVIDHPPYKTANHRRRNIMSPIAYEFQHFVSVSVKHI